MLIVGFGIFGFCDIITLFRPIYAHNKHIMAHLRIPPISKRRWVFNSLGTILWPNPRIFAECFLECTNRWSEMACGKNGWGRASSPLTEFFWAIFAIFWTEIAIFEPKSTENRSLFEWQRQKLEFTGFKGYAIARERHLLTEKIFYLKIRTNIASRLVDVLMVKIREATISDESWILTHKFHSPRNRTNLQLPYF